MNVIAEKRWSYVLFDNGNDWVLTTLTGGTIEIDVSVKLTAADVEDVKKNVSYVENLVEAIKLHRAEYSSREMRPPVWPSGVEPGDRVSSGTGVGDYVVQEGDTLK